MSGCLSVIALRQDFHGLVLARDGLLAPPLGKPVALQALIGVFVGDDTAEVPIVLSII